MGIQRKGFKSRDLTEGSIAKQILLFAIPIILGQVFQNLYNSVDSIVVGNFVGTTALAAVTSSSDIANLIIGFFTGLSTGAGVLFSRYFGAKQQENLKKAIHTSLLLASIIGVVMAIIGVIATPLFLRLVGCPDDVYGQSSVYLRIYFIGVFFTAIYNVASGVLRAVGDSRSPFLYLVIASATNVVLDIVLVALFGMGVEGVAIATIASQLLSCVLIFRNMMTTEDVYRLELKELKIDRIVLKEVMVLGLPAAVQSCLISFSNLFVQRYINGFGSAAMAGTGASRKIDKYAGLISQSIGLSVTTFVSQNVGAGKMERAFRGIRVVTLICFIFIAVIGTPIYFFSEYAVRIFTQDEAAIQYGIAMLKVMMPLYFMQSLHQIFSNAVRGFGRSLATMFTTILGLIVCRQIFLAIAFSITNNIQHVYFGYPLGWTCSALMAFIYYLAVIRIPYKKQHKEMNRNAVNQ